VQTRGTSVKKMKLSSVEKGEQKFCKANDLYGALTSIPDSLETHRYFQHYTTLDNLHEKITSGTWWLSCCTSDRLNDHIECVKYGDCRKARRMYQSCFCHGSGENVAMWGLYQCSKPCAVRITMPASAMKLWLGELSVKQRVRVRNTFVRDLVYVAVGDSDRAHDKYEIPRCNCVSWENALTKKIEGLSDEVCSDWATGLLKDYEWLHERETRLIVEVDKHYGKGIAVTVPNEVFEEMRFTFSPWLKPQMFDVAKRLIEDALTKRLKKVADPNSFQRYRRSVLTGGLNLGDGRIPCAFCDRCKLFGRNA